jgi:hypothetical protein
MDVALETFENRGPIPGLVGQKLVSLEEALAHVDLQDKRCLPVRSTTS